jgi:hypothetical protein
MKAASRCNNSDSPSSSSDGSRVPGARVGVSSPSPSPAAEAMITVLISRLMTSTTFKIRDFMRLRKDIANTEETFFNFIVISSN